MVYLQTDCLKTDVKYGTNRKEDVMFNGSMRVSQPHASKYYIKMSRSSYERLPFFSIELTSPWDLGGDGKSFYGFRSECDWYEKVMRK